MPDTSYRLPLLAARGRVVAHALLDEEDYYAFADYSWHLHSEGYAIRRVGHGRGNSRALYLHRQILGLVPGDKRQADHVNRDRLDNRRVNLRIVTNAANCQNRPGYNTYRGVHWSSGNQCWIAKVKLDYKPHHLGRFKSEIEAGRAAEAFRRAHLPFSQPIEELEPVPACRCRECREPVRRAA